MCNSLLPTQACSPPVDPPGGFPEFRSLAQFIPAKTLDTVFSHLGRIDKCISAALSGDIDSAIRLRPKPLKLVQSVCFIPPFGSFGPIDLCPLLAGTGPAVQLLPSRYPDRPHSGGVSPHLVEQHLSVTLDRLIVSEVCHGLPDDSAVEFASVLSAPAVSALRAISVLQDTMSEALDAGWLVVSQSFVPTWPFIGDSCGVAWRFGNPRVTWDKSGPRSIRGHVPFNAGIDLEALPSISYMSVLTMGRAMAIYLVVGGHQLVACWLFDIMKAYRALMRQRADTWKQGVVMPGRRSRDERLQFGDCSACNRYNRVSSACIEQARVSLTLMDEQFPPRDQLIVDWVTMRRSKGLGAQLTHVNGFFDDVSGGGFDDVLYPPESANPVRRPPVLDEVGWQVLTRQFLSLAVVEKAFTVIGFQSKESKRRYPSHSRLELLGALIELAYARISLNPDKVERYVADLANAESVPFLPRPIFTSLVHKLVHASCIIVRLRPRLAPMFRDLRAGRHCPTSVPISAASTEAFHFAKRCLEGEGLSSIPIASAEAFPQFGDGTVAQYADASGDGADPGFGGWFVIGLVCYLVASPWPEWARHIPIHALELWATTALTCLVYETDATSAFIVEYTDNQGAEWVADTQSSKSPHFHLLIDARADFFDSSGVCTITQRVSTHHNSWADDLSRGRLAKVWYEAVSLGLQPVRLSIPPHCILWLEQLAAVDVTPSA